MFVIVSRATCMRTRACVGVTAHSAHGLSHVSASQFTVRSSQCTRRHACAHWHVQVLPIEEYMEKFDMSLMKKAGHYASTIAGRRMIVMPQPRGTPWTLQQRMSNIVNDQEVLAEDDGTLSGIEEGDDVVGDKFDDLVSAREQAIASISVGCSLDDLLKMAAECAPAPTDKGGVAADEVVSTVPSSSAATPAETNGKRKWSDYVAQDEAGLEEFLRRSAPRPGKGKAKAKVKAKAKATSTSASRSKPPALRAPGPLALPCATLHHRHHPHHRHRHHHRHPATTTTTTAANTTTTTIIAPPPPPPPLTPPRQKHRFHVARLHARSVRRRWPSPVARQIQRCLLAKGTKRRAAASPRRNEAASAPRARRTPTASGQLSR